MARALSRDVPDLDLLEALAIHEARASFWAFRRFMNPKMLVGWWQREVARQLQAYYDRLVAGERPRLLITAPPQHGKTVQIIEFVAWLAGQDAAKKIIYASFSDRLGVRANLQMQRMLDSPTYRRVFPETRLVLPLAQGGAPSDLNYVRSRGQLDFVGHEGYFRNTTVRGAITGLGLDIGVVDDPLKGRAEASSPTVRDAAWEWFTDDFFSRFSEDAGLLMMLTRWHVDDPAGRLLDVDPSLKLLTYPALAIEKDEFRDIGDALFPEHKSKEFLLERKAILLPDSWESLYQQSPYIRAGGMFPRERFTIIDVPPARRDIVSSVRYWDKAGTKEGKGARTAGILMHTARDGRVIVADAQVGYWSALDRETRIKAVAQMDGIGVRVYVEQEPGSGGKESAESTIRNLIGHIIEADRPTGAKEVRAEPFAAQVQGGNVYLLRGSWNKDYLEEMEMFPNGPRKDQVDASSGAFAKLTGSAYDMEALTG